MCVCARARVEIVFLDIIQACSMNKSNGSSVPFPYRKKFLFLPFWSALNIFLLLEFILYIGIKTVTLVLLYDYENKIHPSEEQLLKLFASDILIYRQLGSINMLP